MGVGDEPWELLLARQQRPLPITEVALALAELPGGLCGGSSSGSSASPPPGDGPTTVARWLASELSHTRFCLEFMEAGRPIIIQGATEGWRAAREWVEPCGSINLDCLEKHFGTAQISATDASRQHAGGGLCQQMTLAAYLAWWRQHKRQLQKLAEQQQQQQPAGPALAEGGVAAAAAGASAAAAAAASSAAPAGGPLWYCKDWHLASDFPQYHAYTCPPFFQDDWLNEWLDHRQQAQRQGQRQEQQRAECVAGAGAGATSGAAGTPSTSCPNSGSATVTVTVTVSDYRFAYLGPRGTCTPLHSDVLRSFSWSANLAGRKLWRLLPPQFSHLLLDRHGRSPAWDFFADQQGPAAAAAVAASQQQDYPGLVEARRHLLVVEQQAGEAIFVPPGWFHTVENLDDCASINHNWINGHSLHWTWALLRQERRQAEAAIEDCRPLCGPAEFERLVQRNLGANAGMDYAGAGSLLRFIAGRSLQQLEAPPQPADTAPAAAAAEVGFGGPCYHAFCLQRAGSVLRELLAEQQHIDSGCLAAQQQQGQQRQQRMTGSRRQLQPDVAQEEEEEEEGPPPHAEEVAANSACLSRIEERLRVLGFPLPVS